MTDFIPIDPEDMEPQLITCAECDKTFGDERSRKIHFTRMHVSAETKRPKRTGGGKRPLINKSTRLTNDAHNLMIDVIAAGIAWGAIQWLQSNDVPMVKSDQELFDIPAENRNIMFKPLADALEQFTPAVRLANTVAERMDYLNCLLLWKQYVSNVKTFADDRKQKEGAVTHGDFGTNSSEPSGPDPAVSFIPGTIDPRIVA